MRSMDMERLQARHEESTCQICGGMTAGYSDVTCFDCDRRILVAIQFRMENETPVLVPVHRVN